MLAGVTTRSTSTAPLLLAAALALAALGCRWDCESLCENTKECKGADKSKDCTKSCEHTDQLNEDAECEDDYNEYLNCSSNVADICRVGDGCEPEAIKWTDCLAKFCRNPEPANACD